MSEQKSKLKDFKVNSYSTRYGMLWNLDHPASFEAKLTRKASLDDVVQEIIENIKDAKGPERERTFKYGSRIPYSNKEINKKNKVAAFILLQENSYIVVCEGSGMSWDEGIYGIRIKGNKVKGELIDFGHGDHGPEGDKGDHYRFVLNGIKDGILKYTAKKRTEFKYERYWGIENGKRIATKVEDFEKEYDLKEL